MSMAAAMDGVVSMLAGLASVARSAEAVQRDFASNAVTAVVVYGSPAVEFDIEHHLAYAVNFDAELVATADTEAAAHDLLSAAVHDLARLWWDPQVQDLGGAARQVTWTEVSDFVVVSGEDGRVQMSAPFALRAIVGTEPATEGN